MSSGKVTREELERYRELAESVLRRLDAERAEAKRRIAELESLLAQRLVESPAPWVFPYVRQSVVEDSFDCCANHIRNLIRRGVLEQVRFGGLRFITRKSLDNCIQSMIEEST